MPGVRIQGWSGGGGAQKPSNREMLTCDAVRTMYKIYAQKPKQRLAAPVLAHGVGAYIRVQERIDLGF